MAKGEEDQQKKEPGVGEDRQAAKESVDAIFNALPKRKQMEFLGELNEALLYIERH